MNITDVRVRKISKEGKMKAVVSVTIDDEFVAHPINTSTRERLQAVILEAYEKAEESPEE